MIAQISRSLGREMSVDWEDIASELWLWVLEDPARVEAYDTDLQLLLRKRLTSIGRRFAAKERAQALGYDPEDLAHYSTRTLKELLPDVFDYRDWQSSSMSDGMPRPKNPVNTGGDRVAMLVDIKVAMERLPEEQYNALVWTFKYHYTAAQLADALEINEEAARKRVQRAVRKLQSLLTDIRPMEVPGRRAVMTNAASRALQSGHWDG